ncbi:hypothetical protein [Rhodoplanes roseus]|uniref:hypothetical protein n=1 Tax=Rhodoplanes roseus TaxID=29409 RepID=UPI0014759FAA|nr:hypothetical protein [Rhodoplanes roseus]
MTFSLVAALTGATRVAFDHDVDPAVLAPSRFRMMAMCRAYLRDAALAGPRPEV